MIALSGGSDKSMVDVDADVDCRSTRTRWTSGVVDDVYLILHQTRVMQQNR